MNDLNNTVQRGAAFDRMHVTDTEIIHEVVQDVAPSLEYAANLRAIDYQGPSKEMKLAAHFPDNIINTYCMVTGVSQHEVHSNPVHFKRMLNDPDLSGCRIWQGRV